jgi:hypothetical protein
MNTALVVGSVTTNKGFVSKGNISGNLVEVTIGSMLPNETVTVTFDVTINKPLWEAHISNQALVKGANFSSIKSDDPGTSSIPDDPTIIEVKTSPPVHGPSMSGWGIMTLVTLLGVALVWVMRRKQVRSEIN